MICCNFLDICGGCRNAAVGLPWMLKPSVRRARINREAIVEMTSFAVLLVCRLHCVSFRFFPIPWACA
ncbi:hypothetical protein B0H34DRAFT_680632 [Crassisporium funariophilum]|nr:hypothetical protein B0H34DRAFT_680632 [Crassisporium funariophilum]